MSETTQNRARAATALLAMIALPALLTQPARADFPPPEDYRVPAPVPASYGPLPVAAAPRAAQPPQTFPRGPGTFIATAPYALWRDRAGVHFTVARPWLLKVIPGGGSLPAQKGGIGNNPTEATP